MTITIPIWVFTIAKFAALVVVIPLAAVGVMFLWAFRGGLWR